MAYDSNNIFARILRGEIPSHKVFEDAHTLAFMDVMPQADGHTLVIPKAPAENILDLSPDALAATILTTQRVAKAVKQAFDAPGLLVAQLNGSAAGQSVFHVHFHVVPRHEGLDLRFHAREMADNAYLRSTLHACAPRSIDSERDPATARAQGESDDAQAVVRSAGERSRRAPVTARTTTRRPMPNRSPSRRPSGAAWASASTGCSRTRK